MQLVTLVPVLSRPQNVAPLVLSFLTSETPGLLVFVCEVTDTQERLAIERHRMNRVEVCEVVDARSWPEKINAGYSAYPQADWYLLAADDVSFDERWWQETRELRETRGVGVIGTNDMANPRCIAGEHSTHTLVSGTYVDRYGTIDQPGRVVHEGYHHWFVDDELKYTAMYRKVWAHATGAVIRHHHPYFTPGVPFDATYAKGEASAEQDRKLFCERAPLWGMECG